MHSGVIRSARASCHLGKQQVRSLCTLLNAFLEDLHLQALDSRNILATGSAALVRSAIVFLATPMKRKAEEHSSDRLC